MHYGRNRVPVNVPGPAEPESLEHPSVSSTARGANSGRVKQPQRINIKNHLMKKMTALTIALLATGAVTVRGADTKETWEKTCAKCHGADGKGKTKMGEKLGIKDLTDAKIQADL